MTQPGLDEGDDQDDVLSISSSSYTFANYSPLLTISFQTSDPCTHYTESELISLLRDTLRHPFKQGLYMVSSLNATTSQWRWHLSQWRTKTNSRILSDPFDVGDKKFKMDIRPKGFKNDGFVSMFLEEMNVTENHDLYYRVSIINQKNCIRSAHSKIFKQCFSRKDPGWGVVQLLNGADLYDGFLVNDTLIVQVSVALGNTLKEEQISYLRLHDIQGVLSCVSSLNEKTKKWRWTVPHWSRNTIVNSESFFFGGKEWRLEVVPKRHYSEGHLGIFIRKIGSLEPQIVHFQITLINARKELVHYESGIFSPVFDDTHLCWGFRKYIQLDKLSYGYLIRDTLTFELTMNVDETVQDNVKLFFKPLELNTNADA
jgi:hypothetical protein